MNASSLTSQQLAHLSQQIKQWGEELGFQSVGITDTQLATAEQYLEKWLSEGMHGEMDYMQRHGTKRSRPEALVAGTQRVICARMDYQPAPCHDSESLLHEHEKGFISRYALGRDYHKVLRKRLKQLAERIQRALVDYQQEGAYRVFVDSAPVMEKPLAEKAGLGWVGKHSNVLHEKTGSWFFLGEIYTDLPLPIDEPAVNHCGRCTACIDDCPTGAIVAPYVVDARRCISYLTIELRGSIPLELRPLMGNRIYGCDDCQLVCPWNRFASPSGEQDFMVRENLDNPTLLELFAWDEATFLIKTEGTAIRRIGHEAWLRNIAVALGNALRNLSHNSEETVAIREALHQRSNHSSAIVREHVVWALSQGISSKPTV